MLSAGGLSGSVPTGHAQQSLPEAVREQRGVQWAIAAGSSAHSSSAGGTAPKHVLRGREKNLDFQKNRRERDISTEFIPYPNGRSYRTEAVTNLALHKVMYLPWLGQWRYSFQLNTMSAANTFDAANASRTTGEPADVIHGHSATIEQRKQLNKDPNAATIVASVSENGTPHAMAYPRKGKEKVNEGRIIREIPFDYGDAKAILTSIGDIALFVTETTAGKVWGVVNLVKSIGMRLLAAYYDKNPTGGPERFSERDMTLWTYDDPKPKTVHSRFFAVDVRTRETRAADPIIDVRSDVIQNDHIRDTYEKTDGIRNWLNDDAELTPEHRGQSIASNHARLRLPRLPDPTSDAEDVIENGRDEYGLKPYCYVGEDGSVNREDCIYVATDVEPAFEWV